MKCPKCKFVDSKVIDSRPSDDMSCIRRRRECFKCKHRFTTYEHIEEKPIIVLKHNGSAETFDKDKLFRGIIISCAKRQVDVKLIKKLVNDIYCELKNNGITEIKSSEIGEMVLNKLSEIDLVAYVRFASVYKDFTNVDEFKKILKNL